MASFWHRSVWLRLAVLFGLTLALILTTLSRSAPADAELDRRVAEAQSYLEEQTGHRFTHSIMATRDDVYQSQYIRSDATGEHNLATSRAAAAGELTATRPGQWLVVSRGIGMERGHAPRLRFWCRPEILVVDVVPARP